MGSGTRTDKWNIRESADYNNIKQWLRPILKEKGWSVDDLAKKLQLLAMETDQDKSNRKKKAGKTGKMFVPPTRVSIYNWMADTCRPDEGNMILICKVLDRPTEEGLRQYTPRVEGRPQGYSPKSTFVRTK